MMSDTNKTTVKSENAEVATQTAEVTVKTGEIKKVKILLPRIKGETADVFVSVNNYTCVIKRGVEVEVPEFVAEVLKHQEEMLETIAQFEEKNAQ